MNTIFYFFFLFRKKSIFRNSIKRKVGKYLILLILFSGFFPIFDYQYENHSIDKNYLSSEPLTSIENATTSFEISLSNYTKLPFDDEELINIHILNGNDAILLIWINETLFNQTEIKDFFYSFDISVKDLQIGENHLKLELYSINSNGSNPFLMQLTLILIIEEPLDINLVILLIAGFIVITLALLFLRKKLQDFSISKTFNTSIIGLNSLGIPSLFDNSDDLVMISTRKYQKMQRFIVKNIPYSNIDINQMDDSEFCKTLKKI